MKALNEILKLSAWAFIAGFLTLALIAAEAKAQPNWTAVFIDDLSEQAVEHMPTLQSIMNQGTNFKNAFAASAQCQSVRTAIWTGVAPWTAKYRSNEDGNKQFNSVNRGDFRNWNKFDYTAIDTLPETIRKQTDMETAVGGKVMHQFYRRAWRNPDPRSWDHVFVESQRGEKPIGSTVVRQLTKKWGMARPPKNSTNELHMWDVADAAAAYIQNATGPYFQAVGLYQPHEHWYTTGTGLQSIPGVVPVPLGYVLGQIDPQSNNKARLAEAKPDQWNEGRRYYYASANDADEGLRRVWEARDPNGYFMVMSDHGYCLGERGNWGAKAMVTRCAAAIPWVFVGPDIPAQDVDAIVSSADMYATILGFMGVDLPAHVYGNDLSDAIRNLAPYPEIAITAHGKRDGIRWKASDGTRYLYAANRRGNPNRQARELYNIDADKYELTPIDNEAIRAEGEALLRAAGALE